MKLIDSITRKKFECKFWSVMENVEYNPSRCWEWPAGNTSAAKR